NLAAAFSPEPIVTSSPDQANGPGRPQSSDHSHVVSTLNTQHSTLNTRLCLPVDPARYGGALWAVPLWSERGLIGVLLLGEKLDHSLFSQEEIEIAQASGERMIDTQASAEMARRLMALQRRRLSESQVLDRQARRVLHDDVLPRLHTAMLTLSQGSSAGNRVQSTSERSGDSYSENGLSQGAD